MKKTKFIVKMENILPFSGMPYAGTRTKGPLPRDARL